METFTAKLKKLIFGDERVRRMDNLIGTQKQMIANVAAVKKWADGGLVNESEYRNFIINTKTVPCKFTGSFKRRSFKVSISKYGSVVEHVVIEGLKTGIYQAPFLLNIHNQGYIELSDQKYLVQSIIECK